jgi:Cu/Zn superoxide dismutase
MGSRIVLVILGVICFHIAVPSADAASQSAHAKIVNAGGTEIGAAKITSTPDGVKIAVTVSQLTPGEHGIRHSHPHGREVRRASF